MLRGELHNHAAVGSAYLLAGKLRGTAPATAPGH
jgi:hypothetical protein